MEVISEFQGWGLRPLALRRDFLNSEIMPHRSFSTKNSSNSETWRKMNSRVATALSHSKTPFEAGIRSLIATPFSLNGRLFGAFACTDDDPDMRHSIQHLFLLRRISVRAALAMATTLARDFASQRHPLRSRARAEATRAGEAEAPS